MRTLLSSVRLAVVGLSLAWALPAAAGLSVPPRVTQMNAQNTALTHAGYLDATLYDGWNGHRVDRTGAADSTAGIQQAINDARDYAMVTYLPPGTYLVSDTLLGQASDGSGRNISCLNHTGYGTPFSAPQSPSLVGPASGARPVLKLADRGTGFGDANNPKPLVYFLLSDKNNIGWQGDAACLMWAILRDVDIELGSGNAGAIGVQFAAAQFSYIENVSVNATGAYAGFRGVPSTEVVVNVAVEGGQYGLIPTTCCGISLVGLTLKNQTVAALSLTNFAATMVTGFDIQQPAGSAVINTFFQSQTSEVALLDGHIAMGGGTQAAVGNSLGHDLYAQNVYVQTPGSLVQSGSGSPVAASGKLDLIREYSFTNPVLYTQGTETQDSYALINGVRGQSELTDVVRAVSSIPSDLVTRHLPGPLPWFEDTGVADVTTFGADPTGLVDSTAAIQAAISASDSVFLPRGDYIISATLQLRPNTHLFGVPGMRSRLHGSKTWNPGRYEPFIQSADTATGHTHIGDLELEPPDSSDAQTYLSGVDWKAGRSSVVRQLAVVLPWQNNIWTSYDRKMVHIEGNGGGRWYGLQQALEVPARTISATRGYRQLLVEGTTAPLTFYGPNPEHARNEPEFEFSKVQNVRVLGIKTEATQVVWIENSKNVMFAGHSGHDGLGAYDANLQVIDSANVLMASNQIFSGGSPSPYASIVREVIDGGGTYSVPANDQSSLFKRGTFDATPFPRCGDGVCDGAETSANCPADCGGGVPDAGHPPPDAGTRPSWSACRASRAITVDGDASDWSGVPGLFLPFTSYVLLPDAPLPPSNNADSSATLRTAWDNQNLYVLVEVNDNVVVDGTPFLFYSDSVELYLDGTHSRAASYGAGDYQLTVTAKDRVDSTVEAASHFVHATRLTATGYNVEYAVPWSALGSNVGVLGFDLAVNDDDDGTSRKSQLMWSGDGTAYRDPRQFGDLVLAAGACAAPDAGSADGGGGTCSTSHSPLGRDPVPGGCTQGPGALGAAQLLLLAFILSRRRSAAPGGRV